MHLHLRLDSISDIQLTHFIYLQLCQAKNYEIFHPSREVFSLQI